MRQTVKEIEVNVAYRWFLGLDMTDKVPHFSTFGKNYTRRFKDTDLFEQIFAHILEECYKFKLVDPTEIFVDATHVKARANSRKMQKRIAKEEALFYEDMLKTEINKDRQEHHKKPLKDKDDNNHLCLQSERFRFRNLFFSGQESFPFIYALFLLPSHTIRSLRRIPAASVQMHNAF